MKYSHEKQKGFSLVEIIISLAILAMFTTASVPLVLGCLKKIMVVGEKSQVTFKVQDDLERSIIDKNVVGDPIKEITLSFKKKDNGDSEEMKISNVGVINKEIEREYMDLKIRTNLVYLKQKD